MADPSPNAASPADPSATETIDPRRWLTPGWYWADLKPEEAGDVLTAFEKANPSILVTKTSGSAPHDTVILFQVTGTSPVVWTLSGYPSRALKGADTDVSQIFDSAPQTVDPVEDVDQALKALRAQLSTAGKVLLWGGVAVLLWQFYQHMGVSKPAREKPLPEPEPEEEEPQLFALAPVRSGPRSSPPTLRSRSYPPVRTLSKRGGR